MLFRTSRFLTLTLAVLALALGACSDSDTSPEPTGDTTRPLVAGTSPAGGQVSVATNAAVTVTFNEDMAPATATGQVTLSSGGTPTITWLSDRQFRVTHATAWAQGIEVTVTVNTGLTDAAGNALAEPFTFSFFTETSALLLLDTEPASAATGVSRSANIRLQFSLPVDQTSLSTNTTITDGVTKASYPFSVSAGDNNWYTLDPASTLPSGTLLTVTVGAAVHVDGSPLNTLGTAASFQFTTGVEVDTTPPTILSFNPAHNNTNVPVDVGMLVITFSEPIDDASFNPTEWNVEFALMVQGNGIDPVWSQGNTVVTVPLPTLPAGLEMAMTFGPFRDASGNVQTNETEWFARVAGTADVWPMVDDQVDVWFRTWARGPEGSSTPSDSGSDTDYVRTEIQGGGEVRLVRYNEDPFTTPRDWQEYDRLASSVEWLGFADGGDGGALDEIAFDSPLRFLPLPVATGTWTDNTTVTMSDGTFTATYSGQVIGREDLLMEPLKKDQEIAYYFKGAWKVARTMQVQLDGAWFTTQSDTVWYSPTIGPVHEVTREDSPARDGNPAGWYRTSSWRAVGNR